MTLKREYRAFDGVRIEIMSFQAAAINAITDTYGSWRPDESSCAAGSIVLHHRALPDLSLEIVPVEKALIPVTDDAWQAYLERVVAALGEGARVEAQPEPDGKSSITVMGWPAREALFTHPAGILGQEPRAELHLIAAGRSAGLAIVLAGPRTQVDRARSDLEFFIARLEAR